jgi:predicted nicotinamide N-methyase
MQIGLMLPVLLLLVSCCQVAFALQSARTTSTSSLVANVAVHRVPLYREDDSSSLLTSPYCFAVSNPMTTLPNTNFLATQVWPSARVAAMALERYIKMSFLHNNNEDLKKSLTICEFGCGPGLPSLTAAVISKQMQQQQDKKPFVSKVYATDVDSFALALVQAAAEEQSLTDIVETRLLDLTMPTTTSSDNNNNDLPAADLYLLSDVFESSAVARGAARTTCQVLFEKNSSSTVWVFCQSDRAQRQVYVQEMHRLVAERCSSSSHDDDFNTIRSIQQSLSWQDHDDWPSISTTKRLWLCNVDETKVRYA